MKRYLFIILMWLPVLCGAGERVDSVQASARADSVRALVRSDRSLAAGLDRIYESPSAPPSAPKGWESFYVSHYGRHGSRYAYTSDVYTMLLGALKKGEKEDNLTEYGKETMKGMETLYDEAFYRTGSLTHKGWNQHIEIARNMVRVNSKAFGKGSRIDAVPSNSPRAIVSMGAFCLEAGRLAPKAEIYEHQGLYELQATSPNMGANPLVLHGKKTESPYESSSEEIFFKLMPDYQDILGKFFTRPDLVAGYVADDRMTGEESMLYLFDCMYMLDAGGSSLDIQWPVPQIFSDDEFARMWEVDNYMRFDEYVHYKTPCCSVWLDFMDKADKRIASGEKGADLRFGHDHVIMTLLMLADIDRFDEIPAGENDLPGVFQTYRVPMACNIQLVFYRRKGTQSLSADNVRVRLLLNESPASFSGLKKDADGCYRWSDVREYLLSRTGKYLEN